MFGQPQNRFGRMVPFVRRVRRGTYEEVRRFRTDAEFRTWWRQEARNWKINSRHPHIRGTVEYWRCSFMRGRRYICQARLKLIIQFNGQTVIVNRSRDHPHTHEPQGPADDPSRVRVVVPMEPFPVQVARAIDLTRPAGQGPPGPANNAPTAANQIASTSGSATNATSPAPANASQPSSTLGSATNATSQAPTNASQPSSTLGSATNATSQAPANASQPSSTLGSEKNATPAIASATQPESTPGSENNTTPANASGSANPQTVYNFVPPRFASQAQSSQSDNEAGASSSTPDNGNGAKPSQPPAVNDAKNTNVPGKPAVAAPKSSTAASGSNSTDTVSGASSTTQTQ